MGAPLFYASSYYWSDLIDAGAELYMWDVPKKSSPIARTMHSKLMIVDDCIFAPGSFNLDGRAYNWENEYVFPIFDADFASVGTQMFEEDLTWNGVSLITQSWFDENFSWWDWWKAWFFSKFRNYL